MHRGTAVLALDSKGGHCGDDPGHKATHWRAHVADKWGDLELTKVLPPDVKAWFADLVDAGTGVPTIENALGVLRMVLKDAVEDGRLIRNPCDGSTLPSVSTSHGPTSLTAKLSS